MMPEQHGLCLPRFVWLQPLLSAQPAKIEINSELLIWHNSPEEWVPWTTCIHGKGSECSHWNRHAVYGFTIPACNSSAQTTVSIFFPSWYSTQHCFWPRNLFSWNEEWWWARAVKICRSPTLWWWDRNTGFKLYSWILVYLCRFICSCSFFCP